MNLANRLTLIRIFLVPVLLLVMAFKNIPYGGKYNAYVATLIFIIAASTDGIDGYIARSRKQVTKLGKFLDPLADKLLVSAALVSLVELRQVPAWVAVLIIGREFTVTGLRAIAAAEGVVVAASRLGKVKTVTQIIAIVALLLGKTPQLQFLSVLGVIALAVAVVFTFWSGIDYYIRIRHLLKGQK